MFVYQLFWCTRQELRLERRARLTANSTAVKPSVEPDALRQIDLPCLPSTPVAISAKKNGRQAKAYRSFWCTRQELNLHGVNHKILSLARLPIPPRVLYLKA